MARLIPAWLYDRLVQEHASTVSAAEYEEGEAATRTASAAELRSRAADLQQIITEDAPAPAPPDTPS